MSKARLKSYLDFLWVIIWFALLYLVSSCTFTPLLFCMKATEDIRAPVRTVPRRVGSALASFKRL